MKRSQLTRGRRDSPTDTINKLNAEGNEGGRLSISPKLLVSPSKRNYQKQDAERIASGLAGQGRIAAQKIRPTQHTIPQMVASGAKRSNRGRKPIPVVERSGYSIYNVKASHLVDEFFTRKTDAIHFLEKDQKMPWQRIKHEGVFVPVKVKIIIDEKYRKVIVVE